MTEELLQEGLARELTSRLQRIRKDTGLAVTDRVALSIVTPSPSLVATLEAQKAAVMTEVLAVSFQVTLGDAGPDSVDLEGTPVKVELVRSV